MQEQVVVLGQGEQAALLQPGEDGCGSGRCHHQTGLVIVEARLQVGIEAPRTAVQLDRFFKQPGKEALLRVGAVDFKNAHVFGKTLHFKHACSSRILD